MSQISHGRVHMNHLSLSPSHMCLRRWLLLTQTQGLCAQRQFQAGSKWVFRSKFRLESEVRAPGDWKRYPAPKSRFCVQNQGDGPCLPGTNGWIRSACAGEGGRQAAQAAHEGTAICTTQGLLPSPKGKAGDLGSCLPLEIVPLPSWLIQQ